MCMVFFFQWTPDPQSYTFGHPLSLHIALPIASPSHLRCWSERLRGAMVAAPRPPVVTSEVRHYRRSRPTGHGSEPWQACPRRRAHVVVIRDGNIVLPTPRSEEHTSELQSPMPNPSSVFSLTQKSKYHVQ